MIPRANITAWRGTAPWPDNSQVEQDLVLSRALVCMYQNPLVAEQALFRGGTALHKLYFDIPRRLDRSRNLLDKPARVHFLFLLSGAADLRIQQDPVNVRIRSAGSSNEHLQQLLALLIQHPAIFGA